MTRKAILKRECPDCGKHTPMLIVEVGEWERWTCQECGWHKARRVK